MEAVARELVGRHVVPEVAGSCPFGHELSDHAMEPMLRSNNTLVPVKELDERRVVIPVRVMGEVRVRLEHGPQSLTGVAGLFPNFGEVLEMAGYLTFVPGKQDRIDIREVLVQGRTADTGLLGDVRHRHRPEAVLGNKLRCRVQDRVAHIAAMRLDRLAPQLRHGASI